MKSYAKCHIEHPEKGILLLKRADSDEHGGMWESPGGGIDSGEDSTSAVIREVKEETGLDVTVEYQHTLEFSDDAVQGKKYLAKLFKATSIDGDISLTPDEHSKHEWVAKDKIFDFILNGNEVERWTLTHILANN